MEKSKIAVNKRISKERNLSEMMATNYDKLISNYEDLFSLIIQKTKNILKSNYKVLEIGCGTGIVSLGIAAQAESVVAVDISPKMIAVAKEKAAKLSIDNVDFQIADGYSLPYENNMFDVVILSNILHIVKEPGSLLTEVSRLLKHDGLLVTATDCYLEPFASFPVKILIFIYNIMKRLGILYLNKYRKKDIINLLKENGYEIIDGDIVSIIPVNYYVLVQKR